MYLWRRPANRHWLLVHEAYLQSALGPRLAIIERPDRKRLQLEVACRSIADARALVAKFGGHFRALPRDWLERLSRGNRIEPLRVGKRLIITAQEKSDNFRAVVEISKQSPPGKQLRPRRCLVIPAGAAFGTGEHPTTAMSVRLLEEIA